MLKSEIFELEQLRKRENPRFQSSRFSWISTVEARLRVVPVKEFPMPNRTLCCFCGEELFYLPVFALFGSSFA